MSNFKHLPAIRPESLVRKIGDTLYASGGIYAQSEIITTSGGGANISGASDVPNDSLVSGTTVAEALNVLQARDVVITSHLTDLVTSGDAALSGYVNAQIALVSGGSTGGDYVSISGDTMEGFLGLYSDPVLSGHATTKQYVDSQLSTASGTLRIDMNGLQTTIENSTSYHSEVYYEIEKLYTSSPDIILSTSGVNDLAVAISGLVNGQILEVRTSATFHPITIPSGVSFKLKVSDGYSPTISGQECIKISNGAANILIDGLILENCTSAYGNGRGSAITFNDAHTKAHDLIFSNITIRNATDSAVLLSYYCSLIGDYATPHTVDQMSERIAFVGCNFYKATTDKIEGASLCLRGMLDAYISECNINSLNLGRGILLENCIKSVVERCEVINCNDGNGGEGIKIDELGAISGYRNTAIIRNNRVCGCIEGIDIDDSASCNIIQGNTVCECADEGISIDGGTPNGVAILIGNICYKNTAGIRAESGSVINLKKNVCYNNNTNYLIQNGYSVDDSNSTSLNDSFIFGYASITKNDSTISGALVSDALNTLGTTKQTISGGGSRPGGAVLGQMFFDTVLGVPIWNNGANWVNASGIVV
jgi:hypothetical protein